MWLCVRLSVTGAVVVGRHVETWGECTVEPDELEDCYNNCGEEAADDDGKGEGVDDLVPLRAHIELGNVVWW
jgi:hypothetical protein